MPSSALDHGFTSIGLPAGGAVWAGSLPLQLLGSRESGCSGAGLFEALWDERAERPRLRIRGREVEIPRHQQAYDRDYSFSHQTSRALPITPLLVPFLEWARVAIDARLNGLLLNWYAAPGDPIGHGRTTKAGDYIGPHRDSRDGLVEGAPIVTISFGGTRVFRLRKYDERGCTFDVTVRNGDVVVLPFETNVAYTHEVPRPRSSRGESGRRISITLRAFE
jgi:alkylated DNA repair dioxygenase AlkB